MHRSVAFTHLERLVALGYLATSQRRGLPGKPAKLYQRASDEPLLFRYPARQFALLAKLLATSLSGLGQAGLAAAREVGRAWAASLGVGLARTPAEALQALLPLGAEYQVQDSAVVARNCVFQEACSAAPELICGLHAGIIEGVLAAGGLRLGAAPTGAANGACSFELSQG